MAKKDNTVTVQDILDLKEQWDREVEEFIKFFYRL